MTVNPAALEKLKSLNEEFVRVFKAAAKTPAADFFDARHGGATAPAPDAQQRQKLMREYSLYNRVAGGAINHLMFSDLSDETKEDVVDTLRGLKSHFDKRTAFWRDAARAPFASFGEEKKLAKTYAGYSKKLEAALNLL